MGKNISRARPIVGAFGRRVSGGCFALALASAGLGGCVAATDATDGGKQGGARADGAPAVPIGAKADTRDSLNLAPWTEEAASGTSDMTADLFIVPKPVPRPVPLPLSPMQQIRQHALQYVHAMPVGVSPTSREIAYYDGLDYGLGLDSPSGTVMNQVATGTPSTVAGGGGQTMSFTWRELTSQEDLNSELGVSADASESIGLFSASERMNFSKSVQINSNSVFAILDLQVTNAFSEIDAPGVTANASTVMQSGNMTSFQNQFGDKFVRGLLTGGAFYGTVEIDTTSETDKQNIEASLSGAFSVVGSASVSLSDSFSKAISNHSVRVQVHTEGGSVPSPLPTDPVSLLNAANAWVKTVQTQGVVYLALVDGDSVLPLPNPPTYVDLQNQEDVLTQLSLDRDADMQSLNDISYVKTYPSQFVSSSTGAPLGSADFAALDALNNHISQDMSTITKAADAALSNPQNATLPTLLVPPPAVLPVTRVATGPMVAVPNVDGMYGQDASSELASVGLVASGSIVATTQQDSGYVFYESPPPGTMVPKGSTVIIEIARNPNDE